MAQIAWLGKKSPFCGNVSYGISTTEALRRRGGDASRAWMVGDTDYDERAAVAAGVPFCSYIMRSGTSLLATLRDLVA